MGGGQLVHDADRVEKEDRIAFLKSGTAPNRFDAGSHGNDLAVNLLAVVRCLQFLLQALVF